jgi:large subunit ribosomal protein L1
MAEAKKITTKAPIKAKQAAEERAKLEAIKTTEESIVEQEATEIVEEAQVAEKTTAKAGKRSAKAVKEDEAKIAKEERKAEAVEDKVADKPKQTQNPARTQLERKGKNYRKLAEQIKPDTTYSLKEALALALKTSPAKFDATVELHINLGVDPRHADQNIRDIVVLPAGTGKSVRVAVFADVEDAAAAKKAGAEIAGEEAVMKLLEKGTLDFDVLIAPPMMMAKLGKYAKQLGPKGLMPNPKSGTVAKDVAKAVKEAKAGRVEYRVDTTGIVHVGVGKVSFGTEKLQQNVQAILSSVKAAKPASIKGVYVKAFYITTSMGPSIPVNITEI